MKRTIKSMKKNCTLVAVQLITQLPDEDIFKAFDANGYVDNKGMANYKWTQAAQDLGLQLKEVKVPMEHVKCERKCRITGDMVESYRRKGKTLANIRDEYPVGTFFVTIESHAFVMRDGVIIDVNSRRGKTKAFVHSLHEILNAPEVADAGGNRIVFRRRPTGRSGPKYDRRQEAYDFCEPRKKKGRSPTLEFVLKNTAYTQADCDYDVKQGLVYLVN